MQPNRMTAQVLAFPWPCDLDHGWNFWKLNIRKTISILKLIALQVHNTGQCQRNVLHRQISWVLSLEYQSWKLNLSWVSTNKQAVATHWISSKLIGIYVRKWAQKFFICHTTVTSNEGQGQPNWYQNVDFNGLCHHTKLERNWSVYVWIQATIEGFSDNITEVAFPS